MLWKRVIGHKQAIATLRGQIQAGRIGHAYLFVGISGIGKRQVALAFAASVLNPEQNPETERLIAENLHPDVRRWETEKKSLGVGDIREWQKIVWLPPTMAGRKVILIDDAQKMTPQAQNALLKTLEEPPLDTVFILICSNISKMLSTVISRCRVVRFNPLSAAQLEQGLREAGVDESLFPFMTLIADGSIGNVLELAGLMDGDMTELLADLFTVLENGETYAALQLAERLVKLDTELDIMLGLLQKIWSSALREDGRVGQIRDFNTQTVTSRRRPRLLRDCRAIMDARRQLARYQNKQLVLENLLLGLTEENNG